MPDVNPTLRFGLLPSLTAMNNTAWWMQSMSNQAGIVARDMERVQTAGPDRKGDFLLRNFVPSLITPILMESGLRLVDLMYSIPLMTQELRLKELGYSTLPPEVRSRAVGSLIKDSVFVIPRVLQEMDIRDPNISPEKRAELEKLIRHLQKHLNPVDYLKQQVRVGNLTEAEAGQVDNAAWKLITSLRILDHWDHALKRTQKEFRKSPEALKFLNEQSLILKNLLAGGKKPARAHMQTLVEAGKLPADKVDLYHQVIRQLSDEIKKSRICSIPYLRLEPKYRSFIEDSIKKTGTELWSQHPEREKLMDYVNKVVRSKFTREAIKRFQRTSIWPKMLVTTGILYLYYGCLVTKLDTTVFKRWTDKLVKDRGSTEELVKPAYLALLPYIGLLATGLGGGSTRRAPQAANAGLSEKIRSLPARLWEKRSFWVPKSIRNSYFGRPAFVGAIAIGGYMATAALLIRRALSKEPPKKEPVHKGISPSWTQPQSVQHAETFLKPTAPGSFAMRTNPPQWGRPVQSPPMQPVFRPMLPSGVFQSQTSSFPEPIGPFSQPFRQEAPPPYTPPRWQA